MKVRVTIIALFFISCSHTPTKETNVADITGEPLKNSKELISKGHVSLYQNGAFNVPGTTVMLIPPGPKTLDLASELSGTSAKAAFQLSLKRAKESVAVIKRGSAWSFRQGKNVSQASSDFSKQLSHFGRINSKVIIDRSVAFSHKIIGSTWDEASDKRKALIQWADHQGKIYDTNSELSDEFFEEELAYTRENGLRLQEEWRKAQERRATIYSTSAYRHFVLGNLALPQALSTNWREFSQTPTFEQYVKDHRDAKKWREDNSRDLKETMTDGYESYGARIYTQIKKGNKELSEMSQEYGFSLASLKALKYYLQGLVVEGIVRPVGKISGGALGYLAVNALAYPAMIVTKDGITSMELAVEIVGLGVKSGYAITAPTIEGVAAGALSLYHKAGSKIAPTALYLEGKVEEAGLSALKHGSKGSIKLTKSVVTNGTKYVAVPLSTAGIVSTGVVSSAVLGGSGLAASGVLVAGGEAASTLTTVVGQSAALSTVVVGTSVSVGAGAAVMLYDVGKAITVPPAYALGGGIVLSYGTMVHLSSQTLLAVADASYLVLSLEGPRWVLYAVKGNLLKNQEINSGSVMDLKKMQESGEVFYHVPASEDEINSVVRDLGKDL